MYPSTQSRIGDECFVHFQKGDEGPGSQTEFRLLILGSFRISISLLGAGVHVHSQQFGKFGLPSFFCTVNAFAEASLSLQGFTLFDPEHWAFVKVTLKYF